MNNDDVMVLISETEALCTVNTIVLSEEVKDEMSLRPEWALALIDSLKDWNKSIDDKHTHILFRLIDESFAQIRYGIDRQDKKEQQLLVEVEVLLNKIMPNLPANLHLPLNHIIFDSRLPIEIEEDIGLAAGSSTDSRIDIGPRMPELLEKLRREKVFKTVFDLYEMILPHIQFMSEIEQLSLIAEMAHSKKPTAHELSVLMLLHPKPAIRKRVADVLYHLSDKDVFTSVDLRRLIMIRNWVPVDEHKGIDHLIEHLRKNRLTPAPYPVTNITQLFASSMDGAGASCVMMEIKKNNHHQIAGFLVKIGVGIKDTWVMHKAPKHYFKHMIEDTRMPAKPVSKAYINKIVQHYLCVTIDRGDVPDATFVEVAEIFGANNWQPQPLSWTDEVARLQKIYSETLTKATIEKSLQRSGSWHLLEDFVLSWFETGDIARQIFGEAAEKHEADDGDTLEVTATNSLMQHCGEKWRMVFLVTCLWMRSKNEHRCCADLFTVLHCLDDEVEPSDIPLIYHG